jgi:hypothetical protein
LQDGILRLMKESRLPFYLTGGTALSRFYFNHRYSDDLDFFVNADPEFPVHARDFIALLERSYPLVETMLKDSFARLFIAVEDFRLKVDLVNGVAYRVGKISFPVENIAVDTIENILTNKIGALSRYAAKDIADIWRTCKSLPFQWPEIIGHASRKDIGIDPITVAEIIQTFPKERIDDVQWKNPVATDEFMQNLRAIGLDILNARENSLAGYT